MFSRRDFLRQSSLLALAPAVPRFLAGTARAARPLADARVLVVLQLDGGNDGLNTVVHFADDAYRRLRPNLGLATNDLIQVAAGIGLHPGLRPLAPLWEKGQVAVVQGVGYPNPDRSHFRSMAIWHTARRDAEEHTGYGWIGRALDGGRPLRGGEPGALFVGLESPPAALRGRRAVTSAVARLEDFVFDGVDDLKGAIPGTDEGDDLATFVRRTTLEAYASARRLEAAARASDTAPYPAGGLAGRLRLIARLLKAGFGTRVFYTLQAGYDTHGQQLVPHFGLLEELAAALAAFFADLAGAKLADRVVVLAFSEFGRTIRENASGGTDHGTAGPVFLVGPGVKGGLLGRPPSLTDLEAGEPKMTVDFRRVYASALHAWLGLEPRSALGGAFEPLALFGHT
jgi:uncharacterized protein (DUF1501 family)